MQLPKTFILAGLGLAVLLGLIYSAAFVVYPTMQVLVLEFGEPKRVIKEPGLHWKMPFIESLIAYDNRILTLDASPAEVILADKNRMIIDTSTRYRIQDPLLFYKRAGTEERAAQLLAAQISPDLRKTLGTFKFEDILSSKRDDLMKQVQADVSLSAKELGIDIVDVRIRRADVPKQNSESIYRRMNSERERFAKELRAKGKERAQAIRAEADRQSTVILANAQREADILRGEGDGGAAKVYAAAYNQYPDFYAFYRALRAYETAFLEGETPATFVLDPKESPFFAYF